MGLGRKRGGWWGMTSIGGLVMVKGGCLGLFSAGFLFVEGERI